LRRLLIVLAVLAFVAASLVPIWLEQRRGYTEAVTMVEVGGGGE